MSPKLSVVTTFALALAASPLSAQIVPRTDDGRRTDRATDRVSAVEEAIEAARRRAGVYGDRTDGRLEGSAKVPKGHLPPRGMCRVWIEGVPPGHQPASTSCAQAERDRLEYSNARVIYGDREGFPGKGKGRWERGDDDRRIIRGDDEEDGDRSRRKGKANAGKARGKKAGRG